MKLVEIGSSKVPAIGQGTYQMGNGSPRERHREADALRYGIELGLTLIDTAEMYADGKSEEVVGNAIRDVGQKVFIVTKVWPNHYGPGEVAAVRRSIKRLRVEAVDLYLMHWPSTHYPLTKTLEALGEVAHAGLAHAIGVSNFPTPYLQLAQQQLPPGVTLAADQVEYHLQNRRAEYALLPYATSQHIALMAYRPVKALNELDRNAAPYRVLEEVADRHEVSIAQVALAFLIRSGTVVAIPKAVSRAHILANRRALDLELATDEIARLSRAFIAPQEELPFEAL